MFLTRLRRSLGQVASTPRGPTRPSRRRPCLEALEDRTLLTSHVVVPVGAAFDNVTTFNTLANALSGPSLAAGDFVQIEPGAAPGGIFNANLPTLANLTIQGDPAVGAAEIPAFTVNDAVTITVAQVGFTLRNVQVVLQGGGLTFNANGNVINSNLTCNFAGTALTLNAITQGNVLGSTIVAHNGTNSGEVVRVNTTTGANNLISNNTITSTASVTHNLLHYFGPSTITDRVVGNTLIGNTDFFDQALLLIDAFGTNGLTVTDNTFRDPDSNQVAIAVGVGNQNLTLARNTITLTGAIGGTTGINVVGGGSNPTSVIIANN
jgi:hypothetical protein